MEFVVVIWISDWNCYILACFERTQVTAFGPIIIRQEAQYCAADIVTKLVENGHKPYIRGFVSHTGSIFVFPLTRNGG